MNIEAVLHIMDLKWHVRTVCREGWGVDAWSWQGVTGMESFHRCDGGWDCHNEGEGWSGTKWLARMLSRVVVWMVEC